MKGTQRTNQQALALLRSQLYSSNNITLAKKIRLASRVINNEKRYNNNQRKLAYEFLIFVFDLNNTKRLNEQIAQLLATCV